VAKYSAARLKARDDARAARDKELADFRAARVDQAVVPVIRELFENQLPAEFQPDNPSPCHRLHDWMLQRNLLGKIPQQERLALLKTRDAEDQTAFKRLLMEYFPEMNHG
jgi:hypothetical protein